MPTGNEHNLNDLIFDFINKHGKQQIFAERTVMEKWPEYVGELCAQQSKCISVKNSVLYVKVPNAALRFELSGRKSSIMERINADYSTAVIKDIIFL